jgi:alpha-glutamyl/putrescinyl thymine pyrophosphorylase clade 1
MQHLTDLNYSPVLNFNENEFIVPGPGAFDGINKCFGLSLSGHNAQHVKDAAQIIEMCVEGQEDFFNHFRETPVTLFGRRLHLIDCQNLFCETDKYARKAHPQFNLGRSEIKQKLQPPGPLPQPFFPPKWGLSAETLAEIGSRL